MPIVPIRASPIVGLHQKNTPVAMTGTTVCSPLGPCCGTGTGSSYWCFAGGNVFMIRHSRWASSTCNTARSLEAQSIGIRADSDARGGTASYGVPVTEVLIQKW